jgi:hypothetical protein
MGPKLRELVKQRAGDNCEYCRLSQAHSPEPFQPDHIVAEYHGGQTELGNLCWCCVICNQHKSANLAGVDFSTQKTVMLFDPRLHVWSRHFRWAGPLLVGKTPRGRATINALRINREDRVALRQMLIDEGVVFPG